MTEHILLYFLLFKEQESAADVQINAEGQQQATGLLDGTSSQTSAVRLGYITPFDALIMNKTDVKECPSASEISHRKASTIDTNEKETIVSNGEGSDEDYSPSRDLVSTDDDTDVLYDEVETKRMSKKQKLDRKSSSIKHKKIIDDGDFKSFKERLKKLIAKKRVREACKAGETQEEYRSSDFSDDSDEEDNVSVEDKFVLPRKIWNKLYKYQRVGIKWLWQLHKKEVGGIVADEMGLGKTIQIIAFFAGLSISYKINKNLKLKLGAVLIVCPATVMHQWVGEFHKWWPKFRVAILHDSGSFKGHKATLIRAINKHPGVLVTSYAGLRLNKKELYKHEWQYVILDEGHKIRNPDADITHACKHFESPHRIILSGTPMQNSLKELWSLFDFVYPGKLGTLQVFMTEFSVPITMGGYANASSVQVQTAYKCSCILRDTIGPYILRRLKKDVQQNIELPAKNEQVLFCKLSEEQKDIYKQYINSAEVESMLKGNMKIFPGLIKLRKICNHPDLINCGASKKTEERKNIVADHEFQNGFGYWKRSGKMVVVEALLKIWKRQSHRVLIFTQSKQMLEVLEEFVKTMKYTYLSMYGTTSVATRQGLVKKYNEDKSIYLFLLTTRVGGIGLNLVGANRVVIYDPDWNPSTDSQARERSWRIGQTKDVTIYRLMTTGTIEEKIYHRQIFKQFLANRILTNPLQRRFFKSNDLYELFTLGDIGPKQTSETGAIFAGTGSVIKFKRKSNTSSNTNADCESKPSEKSNFEAKETNKKQDINIIKKRKSRKRKHKDNKIDGEVVDNVDKLELYKSKTDHVEETNKTESEKDVLLSLFLSSDIHSALKHDKIEQSNKPDYVLVEKEAERVAKQAVNALRESRKSYQLTSKRTPEKKMKKETSKPRFGRTSSVTSIKSSSRKINTSSSSVDLSSSALLERMKNRNLSSIQQNTSSSASNVDDGTLPNSTIERDFNEHEVLLSVQDFLNVQPNKSSSTDEIIEQFEKKIPKNKTAVFKEMLKGICIFSRDTTGVGKWKLKNEFRTTDLDGTLRL